MEQGKDTMKPDCGIGSNMTCNQRPATSGKNQLVSVIIAAYGQEAYVGQCLDSLMNQTYSEWEAIVIDDGSPDNVGEVVKEYALRDRRIKFVHSENRGVAAARNLAVKSSKGEYLLMLDADDWISPLFIEMCLEPMEKDHGLRAVLTGMEAFGAENYSKETVYSGYPALLINNPFYITALIRRKDFVEAGGFDETFLTGPEDWELFIRLLSADNPGAVKTLPGFHFHYRKKEVSRSAVMLDSRAKIREYVHPVYEKHRDKYRKFFDDSLQEWMLLNRSFNYDIKYLVRPEYREPESGSLEYLKNILYLTTKLATDPELLESERLHLLKSIHRLWDKDIKKENKNLSGSEKRRWSLLGLSPAAFVKYCRWKKK